MEKGADSELPGWQPKENEATAKTPRSRGVGTPRNCQAGPAASSTPLPEAVRFAPLVGRPADYLPSGIVGQWLPARAMVDRTKGRRLEPTMRQRGRLGPRAWHPEETAS